MEFTNPRAIKWLGEHPWVVDAAERAEEAAERQRAANDVRDQRRRALIAEKHAADADIAEWNRGAESFTTIPNHEDAISFSGHGARNALAPHVATVDLERFQRRKDKAIAGLAKIDREARNPPGLTGWGNKLEEVRELIGKLAMDGGSVKPYELLVTASRKAMAEAGAAADAAHAERRKVAECYPDKATAQALALGALRASSPLHFTLTNFDLARRARVPLVDIRWGEGRAEPLAEDVHKMFLWAVADKLEAHALDEIERRYEDLAERGAHVMDERARRRELGRLDAAIHEAELEEAGHLIGLMELEGTILLPPARLSARALLGIL